MPVDDILKEDWSDYDNKKIIGKADSNFFSCSEIWERNYLASKIKKKYPFFDDFLIHAAINQCCFHLSSPVLRRTFISCVYRRLGVLPS